MIRRIMEDIKLENGKIHKIIKSDYSFNVDNDADDIKEVTPRESNKEMEDKVDKYINYRYSKKTLERTPQFKEPSDRPVRKWTLVILLLCVFGGIIYFSSIYFERATVNIVAKEQVSALTDKQFNASKEKDAPLGFEIMIMSGEETKSMTLTETQNVSVKSTGEVTLYNEFSKNGQNLLIGTFLSDDEGKTYRIDKAVNIPGFTVDQDKKIIPGSVSVSITAFLPGKSYDGNPTDFHIVGFKSNSAKYQKIYGKGKTPLSGGTTGLMYVLSEDEKKGIVNMADSLIKGDLQKKLTAEVPAGYIFYPGAISYTYNLGQSTYFENPKADVGIAYSLSVVLLKKEELTKTIIKNILPKITGKELDQILITDLSKLEFKFVNEGQFINKEMQSVQFTLNGNVELIWKPDVKEIRGKIVGVPKASISPIFNGEVGIASALLKMFPPWQNTLPTESSRIKIKIK